MGSLSYAYPLLFYPTLYGGAIGQDNLKNRHFLKGRRKVA